MFFFVFMLILVLFLIVLLKLVANLISEKSNIHREELSSYECGFEPNSLSRIPFSLRYFFLTLVFLLFDLEVVLMLFAGVFLFSSFHHVNFFVLVFFVFILLAGLFYEWQDGTLDWLS